MGASVSAPLRHDIDAQCDPLDQAAHASKLRYAINEKDYPGEDATGTFVSVLARHGTIVDVYMYSTEMQTRGPILTKDCYLRGRLARMRTSYEMRPSESLWTRTKYYSGDGSFMTQTDEHHHLISGDDTPVGPAPKDEPVYRTPAALPFYRAFVAKQRAR